MFAVTGTRGVGKTQAAAACARRRIAERWRLVAWVDADSEATLLAGLALVAAAAGIGEPGADARDLAAGVRRWLEADGDRRLLVLDNADDPDTLRPYLPAAGAAQVIVTSSRRSAAGLGVPVPVEVFTEREALVYLAERTGLDDEAGARELACELGCLPLGLAQAAALISRQHLGYQTYLERLRSVRVSDYLQRVKGDAYPYRLAEAVELSLLTAENRDLSGVCARSPLNGQVPAAPGQGRVPLYPAVTGSRAARVPSRGYRPTASCTLRWTGNTVAVAVGGCKSVSPGEPGRACEQLAATALARSSSRGCH